MKRINVSRGAWKVDRWLDEQLSRQKKQNDPDVEPDRYFVAFCNIYLPIASHKAWPAYIPEVLFFEQPSMPSLDDVIDTAKKAWRIARRIEITNFYEMSEADAKQFLGDESGWSVIED